MIMIKKKSEAMMEIQPDGRLGHPGRPCRVTSRHRSSKIGKMERKLGLDFGMLCGGRQL